MLDVLASIITTLLYAAILSCAGVVFAEATLHGSPDITRFSLRVMRRGAMLTIAAALGSAVILVYRLGGSFNGVTLNAVFLSISGAALCLQLGGAFLLLTSFGDDQFARTIRLVNAGMAMLSFAFHGHASGGDLGESGVAVIHLSAAAWWVGSLWLLYYSCSMEDLTNLVSLVLRFSAIAVRIVGVLLMAGVILAILLISTSAAPLTSPYVQILAIKVSMVAITMCLAIYNKFRLTPRLARYDATAAGTLRAMIRNEMLLITVVLLITAVLTTYTTPFVEYDV